MQWSWSVVKAKAYRSVLLAVRAWLRRRARPRPRVTVVLVSFNSLELLPVTVAAVRRFAPNAELLVVDNDSRDGTRAWLRRSDVPHLLLHNNVWHGLAMDLGFLRAGTEYVVALDVDAFPISDAFLPALLEPLRAGATVCGASMEPAGTNFYRSYVHPCCLAMRLDRFVERRHSFEAGPEWDVGESITLREERPHLIPVTDRRGPGAVGTVFGDIVYHNFYGTRFSNNDRQRIDQVPRGEPELAWAEAVDRYLGEGG